MATYEKLQKNGHKVQVESAIRDGLGKNIANNYAKQNGAYEGLRSGLADNLVAQLGNIDTTPYIFRTSGGNADISGTKKVNKIVANTIKYNQLVQNWNFESTSGWVAGSGTSFVVSDNKAILTISEPLSTNSLQNVNIKTPIIGHNYLISCIAKSSENTRLWFSYGGSWFYSGQIISLTQNEKKVCSIIVQATNNTTKLSISPNYAGQFFADGGTVEISKVQVIDLTALGLDSITTLEQFYATYLGKLIKEVGYLDYTEGSISTTNISKMVNVGYNAFDGEWEVGGLTRGIPTPNLYNCRSKNYIHVIGGQEYSLENGSYVVPTTYAYIYEFDNDKNFIGFQSFAQSYASENQIKTITLNVNTCYVRIMLYNSTSGYDYTGNLPSLDTFSLHLTWSGSRTGYEPYVKHEYPVSFTGYGVNGIGDELYPDGTTIRKFAIIDLGSLGWERREETSFHVFQSATLLGTIKEDSKNLLCVKYGLSENWYQSGQTNKSIFNSSRLRIRDDEYTDAETFKNSLNGVYLIYELETPTTEQGQPYTENQLVDDYGTEEIVSSSTIPVPVGHETFYQINLQNFLQRVYQYTSGNPNDLVLQEQLEEAVGDIDLSDYAKKEEAFNVINASDIVNNTLTQAQYDLITNGKPTIILGLYSSKNNQIWFTSKQQDNTLTILSIGSRDQYTQSYIQQIIVDVNRVITFNSKQSIFMNSSLGMYLSTVYEINGKVIPTYPSSPTSPKVLTYGTNNELSWEDKANPLYKHTIQITSGSDITDLIVVSNKRTAYTDIASLQTDFLAGNITSVSGTFNNQNANNECVLNFVMPKVSGTAMFGVALVNAQNQTIRCLVLTGTLTDTPTLI